MPAEFRPTTFWGLFMEYGTIHIPALEFAVDYMGMESGHASRQISSGKFPIPVFKPGGKKSKARIDINDAVDYLDKLKDRARHEFKLTH